MGVGFQYDYVTDTPLTLPSHYKGPEVERDVRLQHPDINKTLQSIHSKTTADFLGFLCGLCGMEIAVLLLLLIVPLTVASPLRAIHRSDTDADALQEDTVQASTVEKEKKEQHVHALKIIPFHSEDKHVGLDALKHSMAVKLRLRRAPQRGCHLGTCQLHNLADTLYNIGKTQGKEESEKASSPQGYGK